MRKIRLGLLLASCGLAACGFAQTVTLDAFQNGKAVGNVQFTRSIQGGIQTNITKITSIQNGTSTVLVMTAVFDPSGTPLSKGLEVHQGGQNATLKAILSKGSAHVAIDAGGKKATRDLPTKTATSITDPSIWWFVKTAPKPGASVKYQSLNLTNMTWEDIESIYGGKKAVKVGAKTVTAHQVTQKRQNGTSTIYVDDKGMPVLIEQPTIRFVRRP